MDLSDGRHFEATARMNKLLVLRIDRYMQTFEFHFNNLPLQPMNRLLLALLELGHGGAHGLANIHVCLTVFAVVPAR